MTQLSPPPSPEPSPADLTKQGVEIVADESEIQMEASALAEYAELLTEHGECECEVIVLTEDGECECEVIAFLCMCSDRPFSEYACVVIGRLVSMHV